MMLLALFLIAAQSSTARPQNPVAGSVACVSCHKTTYERWSASIHGKMIQQATRQSVASKTDVSGGPEGKRFWRGASLFIEEDGVEHRVDLTLGNRRIQHYLTKTAEGQIIVLHSTWDVKREQWFDSSEIVPGAPPHFVQQWNMTCFYCHVTQQVQDIKGFDPNTLTYRTEWVESSATCERCHGPMADHASGAVTGESLRKQSEGNTNYDRLMRCGQCHWAKTVMASGYNTRKRYFDYYSPGLISMETPGTPAPSWWSDGRPRRFSMEAAAFFLSGCFQSGKAFCTSCHDPHWNRTDGNETLMQHPDQYCEKCHADHKTESHTKHRAESAGSSCATCHMPFVVNGVKAKMRDHSMLSPEPENTVRYQIPNACNECHADRTAEWALDRMNEWYPKRSARPRTRAEAFTLAGGNDANAVRPLIHLADDATENPMIRASATAYLAQYRNPTAWAALTKLSTDKDPLVRLEAAGALGNAGDGFAVKPLERMLADTYRTVRIRAASSLVNLSFALGPTAIDRSRRELISALDEYRRSLELDADYPTNQVRLGSLGLFMGQVAAAKNAYTMALKLNPREPDAYIGLAFVELASGNADGALKNARRAAELSNNPAYQRFIQTILARKQQGGN
jgi:hypothetical protein